MSATNYSLTAANGTITINAPVAPPVTTSPSTITVTGTTSFIYTGTAQGPATATVTGSTGAITYSYSGTGTTTYGPATTIPTNAGSYEVVASVAADANFDAATSATLGFTIGKASLNITADNKNKCADGANYTGYTVTYNGFVNGETATALGGTLSYTGTATAATTAGSYVITPNGRNSANYDITYINGTLTINATTAPIVGTITQPTCNTATGSVVLNGLPAGNWTINPGTIKGTGNSTTITGLALSNTYNFTVTSEAGCVSTNSANIVISPQPANPTATISYANATVLKTVTTAQQVTRTGTASGTFSATPAGLTLDALTGDIIPSSSSAGTYTISYTIAAANGCNGFVATTTMGITNDFTWTGAVSNDFNDPGNWNTGVVPTVTSNIHLTTGVNTLVITEDVKAQNVVVDPGTTLTITGTLQISGTITNNGGTFNASQGTIELVGTTPQTIPANTFVGNTVGNLIVSNPAGVTLSTPVEVIGAVTVQSGTLESNGNLVLVSTATGTAFIDGSGAGNITGTVTMQRHLDAAFGYKYISSPFQSTNASGFVDLKATFSQLYWYDENSTTSGWMANRDGQMAPMMGYASNFGASTLETIFSVNGVLNNGDMSTTLFNHDRPYTSGFNLVGNPYPSPIDWDAKEGWTKTGIDDAVYFLNADGTDQYGGTYSSYVGGVSTGGTNVIAAMQGFFVHVTNPNSSGTLGFSNKIRVNAVNPSYKSSKLDSRQVLRFAAAFDEKNSLSDPFVVYFDQQSTKAFDSDKDALKLLNTDETAPNIYTLTSDAQQLSINGMPVPTDATTRIPVGIKTYKDGYVNFTAKDIAQLPSGMSIYLLDLETNMKQDLRKSANYRFFMKSGRIDTRFVLLLTTVTEPAAATVQQQPVVGTQKLFSLSRLGQNTVIIIGLDTNETGKLYVTNMNGQKVMDVVVTGNQTVEFGQETKSGVYVITVVSGSRSLSEKALIRKE